MISFFIWKRKIRALVKLTVVKLNLSEMAVCQSKLWKATILFSIVVGPLQRDIIIYLNIPLQ